MAGTVTENTPGKNVPSNTQEKNKVQQVEISSLTSDPVAAINVVGDEKLAIHWPIVSASYQSRMVCNTSITLTEQKVQQLSASHWKANAT